jgi:F-type H+/Na+-transporting ATPase subunit alpha
MMLQLQIFAALNQNFLISLLVNAKAIFDVISETKQLEDDTVKSLEEAVSAFKKIFVPSVSAAVNEAEADALEGVEAEQITKHVPPAVKK